MHRRISIGYVPYSKNLNHPGDRRRIGILLNSSRYQLNIESPLKSEILILSGAANFNYWIKRTNNPIILDLVDGYLGETPSLCKDSLRNFIRSVNGTSNYGAITYSRALKKACIMASAIIVASQEQADLVKTFNKKVFVILDDHSELDAAKELRKYNFEKDNPKKFIFWEGFGYTLKHFKFISKNLDKFLVENDYYLQILTTPTFAKWGGYIGRVNSEKFISKWFHNSKDRIKIVPWTLENVIWNASISEFALIPIDTRDRFADLKPENKLLSMWHMGIPTLFSDSRAYKRVANETGVQRFCISKDGWSEALRDFSLMEITESMIRVSKFIENSHTKEILINQWESVLDQVLKTHKV